MSWPAGPARLKVTHSLSNLATFILEVSRTSLRWWDGRPHALTTHHTEQINQSTSLRYSNIQTHNKLTPIAPTPDSHYISTPDKSRHQSGILLYWRGVNCLTHFKQLAWTWQDVLHLGQQVYVFQIRWMVWRCSKLNELSDLKPENIKLNCWQVPPTSFSSFEIWPNFC